MVRLMLSAIMTLLLFCAAANADDNQAPPLDGTEASLEKKILELINSPNQRDRAWGAYYAGRHKVNAAAPLLLALLKNLPNEETNETKLMKLIVVTTLINLRQAVSNTDMQWLIERKHYKLALALIARKPTLNLDHLNQLLDREDLPDLAWVAAMNILIEEKAKGLCARLILETKVKVLISVHDGVDHEPKGRKVFFRFQGSGRLHVKGFPNVTYHTLSIVPHEDSTVLATGPTTVYFGWGGNTKIDRNNYRMRSLAWMAGANPEKLKLSTKPSVSIIWKDQETIRKKAVGHRDDLVSRWRELAQCLVKNKRLDAVQAETILPVMKFEIVDVRKNKTPRISELEIETLEITNP